MDRHGNRNQSSLAGPGFFAMHREQADEDLKDARATRDPECGGWKPGGAGQQHTCMIGQPTPTLPLINKTKQSSRGPSGFGAPHNYPARWMLVRSSIYQANLLGEFRQHLTSLPSHLIDLLRAW